MHSVRFLRLRESETHRWREGEWINCPRRKTALVSGLEASKEMNGTRKPYHNVVATCSIRSSLQPPSRSRSDTMVLLDLRGTGFVLQSSHASDSGRHRESWCDMLLRLSNLSESLFLYLEIMARPQIRHQPSSSKRNWYYHRPATSTSRKHIDSDIQSDWSRMVEIGKIK